jgi:hypothetical protein
VLGAWPTKWCWCFNAYTIGGRYRGSQEAVPNLVRFGARDARADWRTARGDGLSCQNGRGSLGGDPRPIDLRSDHRLHGRVQ